MIASPTGTGGSGEVFDEFWNLHRKLHAQKLGGELLWDALAGAVTASDTVAARLVVVDAIDDHAGTLLYASRL